MKNWQERKRDAIINRGNAIEESLAVGSAANRRSESEPASRSGREREREQSCAHFEQRLSFGFAKEMCSI